VVLQIGPVDVGRSYLRGQSILAVEVEAVMRVDFVCSDAEKACLQELRDATLMLNQLSTLMIDDHVLEEDPCLSNSACVCCASGIPLCGNERPGTLLGHRL